MGAVFPKIDIVVMLAGVSRRVDALGWPAAVCCTSVRDETSATSAGRLSALSLSSCLSPSLSLVHCCS